MYTPKPLQWNDALKIHEEISNWIVNHILRVDGELYPCIHHRPKSKN